MSLEDIIAEKIEAGLTGSMDKAVETLKDRMFSLMGAAMEKPKYQADDLLNEQQVAEYLGIEKSTLQQWRHYKKNIPYIQITPKVVRYKFQDVIDFEISRKIKVIRD